MSLSRRGSSSATRTVCFLVVMGTFRTIRCSCQCNLSRFRQQRQREQKRAALACSFALCPDPTSVCFDESLTDCQSETRAADDPCHLAVNSVESIEDSIQFGEGHTQALVCH